MDGVSKNLAVLFFLVYYSSQVETQDQGVYLQLFNGTRISNHGFVSRGDLSTPTDIPLLCVTPDNITCCSTAETGGAPLGYWYFPNGTEVPANDTGWLFYITRGPGVVRLHRRGGGVSGIHHCVIPDQSGVNQTLYVGLYAITSQQSGQILLQQNIEFQLLPPEPITDPPTFTLTCVTTGGPPTNVVWRKNNIEIDYQSNSNFIFSQTVTNFVNSTYSNTLTVTGRHPGQYNMTAWNRNTVLYQASQPATCVLSVKAAAPPTCLTTVQGSDPTTVNVSWTAPVSGASLTGYRIHYQTEGDQGSVDVGASATQYVLSGLDDGRNYSIYLVALSAQLPSPLVGPAVVTLGGIADETFCTNVTTSPPTTIPVATTKSDGTTNPSTPSLSTLTTDSVIITSFSTTDTDAPTDTDVPTDTNAQTDTDDTIGNTTSPTSTLSTTPDSTGISTSAVIAGVVGGAVLLGLLVLVMCICLIFLRSQNSGAKSGGSLRSKEDIPMQACEAYETINTQQTERRNSSVDECPAYEMVEGEHGVGKDDSDAYDYDYVETLKQS